MKNRKAYIIFELNIEGQKIPAQVYADELRNIINNNLEKGAKNVEIPFQIGENVFKIPFKVSELRRMIKQAELYVNIIPKSLLRYMEDITQTFAKKRKSPIVGRDNEIEKAWFYISQKTRNNVFLVGERDVGKTTIATEIIRQIATNECPKEFYDKRVIMLKPQALLKIERDSYYKNMVVKIIKFLYKNRNNIVLYIDKSIYMKTDELLIAMLYNCITKFNIPIITTSSEENFEKFFLNDLTISKYVNYVYVEEPELEEIQPLVRNHILSLQKEHNIKISDEMVKFGIFTSELSDSISANPGKVINIFERAFLEAKRKDKQEVDKVSILSCYDAKLKYYNKMSKEEKIETAFHETGHYILAINGEYKKNTKVSCVSILPMDWWAGVTMSYRDLSEYVVYSREYFIDYIAFLLAGRVAEKKFTNLNSIGASNDLERANSIARAMIMQWGFSETEHNRNRQYDLEYYYLMPESKKELIDQEVQKIIDEGTKRAEEIIEQNEGLLKIIAQKLLEEEVLSGEQLEAICKEQSNNK